MIYRILAAGLGTLDSRIAGRQVPKPMCLSPAANSLDSRIAGRQQHNLTSVTGVTLGSIMYLCLTSNGYLLDLYLIFM